MKHSTYFTVIACLLGTVHSFQVAPPIQRQQQHHHHGVISPTTLRSTESVEPSADEIAAKREQVGNLVADDEWEGLGMELSELVRTAVIEDLKKKSRDFLGKEEYKGTCVIGASIIIHNIINDDNNNSYSNNHNK